MKRNLILSVTVLCFALFASCANDGTGSEGEASTDNSKVTPTTTTQAPANNVAQPAQNAAEAAPTGPTTTMTFDEMTYDFGEVPAGEVVKHTYTFKNTGKEPLVISNAKGTCGCTVPTWPKEPIPPGGAGEIPVEFKSKGKSGMQTKRVIITANTNPPKTNLTIKGMVNKVDQPAASNN